MEQWNSDAGTVEEWWWNSGTVDDRGTVEQ